MRKPHVYMRIRPAAETGGHAQEGRPAAAKVLQAYDDSSVTIGWSATRNDVGRSVPSGTKYDYPEAVFPPEASQDEVYKRVVPPLLNELLGEGENPTDPQSINNNNNNNSINNNCSNSKDNKSGSKSSGAVSDILLFAYGQTGTGKTHTTIGPDASLRRPSPVNNNVSYNNNNKNKNNNNENNDGENENDNNENDKIKNNNNNNNTVDPRWGIFPRAVYDIFDRLESRNETFVLSLSAVEFYLGMANDLLAANSPVALSPENEAIGLQNVVLRERHEVFRALAIARHSRHTRHTEMNAARAKRSKSSRNKSNNNKGKEGKEEEDDDEEEEEEDEHAGSSRGHAMFILTVIQSRDNGKRILKSTFNLTDLAGAERPGTAGAERVSGEAASMEAYSYLLAIERGTDPFELSTGAQAFFINFELYAFCDLIIRATEYNKYNSKKKKTAYKPSAMLNSPALRIMGRCMSGDAVGAAIVTLSQAPQCGWETWFSCEYGATLAKLRSNISTRGPRLFKSAISSATDEIATNTAALERKIANKMVRWKRLAAISDARSRLVLLRELALKIPTSCVDPNDRKSFLLPEPPTTGWVHPNGNKYDLRGIWSQVSLEEFFAWDFSAPGAAESWIKTPLSSQRLVTNKAMDAAMLDPVNQHWLEQCPPSDRPLIVDTTPYAPCDNPMVSVFVHRREKQGEECRAQEQPIIVYAHSGGAIYSRSDHASTLCARLAAENDVIVLNVEYRLAPENPAPAGIMDVAGIVLYLHEGGGATALQGDIDRIILMGDSGGGYIAAGAAAELARRGRENAVSLCVPMWPQVSDIVLKDPLRVEGGASAIVMWNWIEKQLKGRKRPGKAPVKNSYVWINRTNPEILKRFPRTAIVTSEFDECRRMAEDFARRLVAVGTEVELIIHPGTHHCWGINMSRPDADECWRDISSLLSSIVG